MEQPPSKADAGEQTFLGHITDGDRLMWQCQAAKVLAEVLGEAARSGLPFVCWSLGTGRTIIAKCLMGDDAQRRAAFTAWARFFGIVDAREWKTPNHTYLHASRTDFRGCSVIVDATLNADVIAAGDRP